MTKPFKDFLYLDSDFVSDLYGQIFQEEIIEKILSTGNTSAEQSSTSTGNSESDSAAFKGNGSVGVVSMGTEYTGTASSNEEEQFISIEEINSAESVTVALNNFKYSKVVENLRASDLINISQPHKQYDFIEINNSFEYYDFEKNVEIFNFDKMVEFMYTTHYTSRKQFFDIDVIKSDYKNAGISISNKKPNSPFKTVQEAEEYRSQLNGIFNFRNMDIVSDRLSAIFQNNVLLLSSTNEIVICNKKFLKTNSVSLIMSKKINATIVGRVINNPELANDTNDIKNYFEMNEDEKTLPSSLLNGGASFFIMNYLQNFFQLDPDKQLYIIQAMGVEYS